MELDDEKTLSFQNKLYEISDFVERHWPESLALKRCERKVRVHESCSQRNVLKNQQSVYRLLSKIPGLEVEELADNQLCCGAGGSYMLTHPSNADALRDLKWKQIRQSDAECLATSNIGCALHLATAEDKSVDIVHPIRLIADQL